LAEHAGLVELAAAAHPGARGVLDLAFTTTTHEHTAVKVVTAWLSSDSRVQWVLHLIQNLLLASQLVLDVHMLIVKYNAPIIRRVVAKSGHPAVGQSLDRLVQR